MGCIAEKLLRIPYRTAFVRLRCRNDRNVAQTFVRLRSRNLAQTFVRLRSRSVAQTFSLLYRAVSQIFNLLGVRSNTRHRRSNASERPFTRRRSAGYKPAIQQVENLRYFQRSNGSPEDLRCFHASSAEGRTPLSCLNPRF
jgi:hypothetical protein